MLYFIACLVYAAVPPSPGVDDAIKMDTIMKEGIHLFMTQMLQSVADDCKTCLAAYTEPAIDLFKDVCAICITEYKEHGLNLYSKSCQDCIDIYQAHLMAPYAGTYFLCRKYYSSYSLEVFGASCVGCITAYIESGLILAGEECSHCLKLFIAHSLTVYGGSCYTYFSQVISKELARANISVTRNFKLGDIMYDGPLLLRLYKKYHRMVRNYYLPLWHSFYQEKRYFVLLATMSLISLLSGLGLLHCGIYT